LRHYAVRADTGADTRTISRLEAEGYPRIGCECCKGAVWVPFKMIREKVPLLSAMTLDEVGARLRLSPQARLDPKSVARREPYLRPWEAAE